MKKFIPIFILLLCFVSCDQISLEEVAEKGKDQSFDVDAY